MGTTLQSEVKSCPIRALDIPGRPPLPSLWHLLLFSCRGNWPTKTYLHITHSRVQAMTNGFHFLIIDWWYLDTPDCPNWLRDKILFIFVFFISLWGRRTRLPPVVHTSISDKVCQNRKIRVFRFIFGKRSAEQDGQKGRYGGFRDRMTPTNYIGSPKKAICFRTEQRRII